MAQGRDRKRKQIRKNNRIHKATDPKNNSNTYILILIGGIFVLIGGLLTGVFGNLMIVHMGAVLGIFAYMGIIGVISGILMIVSAVNLNNRKLNRSTWGVIALVFTILSLVDMGGFGIGFLLGLIGSLIELTRSK